MPRRKPRAKQFEPLDAEPGAPHDNGWRPGQHDDLPDRQPQMMGDWASFLAGHRE
jgi:hypothetical protein